MFRQDGLVTILSEHVRENHAALDLHLTEQDLAQLDRAFPAPTGLRPLEML
jgi:diketogulonate reductase-like aldo/keto reductase